MDIPGYELLELFGQGGFGSVYRARQLAVQREVALKVDSRVLATERDRRRFMREVTAAGRLSGHPNVVAVYDAGLLGDARPYMVMELCPGGSLADRLRDKGPFSSGEVRDIGTRVADAVAAAHSIGVLHRDIKPGNILVDGYGNPALADFGLAAMPQPGSLESSATREALTPAFAPPEAFRMEVPSPAGDVYSLAATLYALLSGRPPHFPPQGQPSLHALMNAHTRPVPDIPGASPALTAVLRQAMAYDPALRPPTAAAFRDALANLDITAPPATVSPAVAMPSWTPGPGGVGVASTVAPVKRGASKGVILGAAGLVAAAILGAGALVAFTGHSGTASPKAKVSVPVGGPASSPAPDPYGGVETVSDGCPAAQVPGARARCTKAAECWGGIVEISGDVKINRIDCVTAHVWETFAIAPLPQDAQTYNAEELTNHPTVKALCSPTVLTRSRFGKALKTPADKWTIQVVPPSSEQYAQGNRTFRCVATITGAEGITGTAFRPRT